MVASKWIPPNGVNIIPDESLAKYLRVYSLKNLQYLMSFCSAVPMPSLDKLRYIAEEKGVYCKETIYDFHCFCVRLILGFARTLDDMSVASIGLNLVKIEAAAACVTHFGRAMLCMAHSKALLMHLELLTNHDLLSMPLIHSKEEYEAFVGACLANGGPPSMGTNAISGDSETVAAPSGKDLELLTEPSEDSVLVALAPPVTGNSATFRKWIMAFVSHFSAQHRLEQNVWKLGPTTEFQIRFIAAERPDVNLGSWNEMTKLVVRVVDHIKGSNRAANKFLATKFMTKLKQHIKAYDKSPSQEKHSFHGVYRQFSELLRFMEASVREPESLFTGTLHAEAILAILAKYYKLLVPNTTSNQGLLDICEVSVDSTHPFT